MQNGLVVRFAINFSMAAGGFLLGGGQVGRGQFLGILIPVFRRFLVSTCCRKGKPNIRFHIILWNAHAIVI